MMIHQKRNTFLVFPLLVSLSPNGLNGDSRAGMLQTRDEDGVTVLMRAARDGERDNVKAFLEQGVEVNARDSYGWAALTYAAAKGDADIVKALLAKGADLRGKDEEGYTPLMVAAARGHAAIVKLLIAAGADVNQQDKNGNTVLSLAAHRHRDKGIVELLKRAGAVDTKPGEKSSSGDVKASVDTPPVLLYRPVPSYTTKARDKLIEGVVEARVLVGSDGTVKRVRVLAGLPCGLSYQAMDAAYQLRFKPATKDGQPVACWIPLEVEFRLKR